MASKEQPTGKHSAVASAPESAVAPSASTGAKHSAAPRRSVGRTVAIVVAALAGALVLVYLAGVLVFSQLLFLPGTSVNGESVSLRGVGEVAAEHGAWAEDYELSVSGYGLDLTIPSAEVDLAVDGMAYARDAMAQTNAWLWPYLAFGRRELSVAPTASFDERKVVRVVDLAVSDANQDATPPVDASVALDTEGGRYVIAGGVPGTELDADAVVEAVSEALAKLDPTLAITKDALALPKVLADDEALVAEAETLNKYAEAWQTLTVAGTEVRVVDGAQIAQWMVVGDDLSVTLNGEAMTAWARGELSQALDSVGSARAYTRPDGKAIEVSGGTYGWSIDGAALATQMLENIQAGTAATIEVPMLQTAASWNPGGADWGARYIDIDLSEQYVRFYDDAGSLAWESACVSGDTSKGHATPTGVYSINGNMTSGNVELRGLIDPATNEPEYISYVTYWMPFIDNAIALHDASWRSSFGGTIFQWNGSHACVNLPTDAAASLYGLVRVGDVVVVHG